MEELNTRLVETYLAPDDRQKVSATRVGRRLDELLTPLGFQRQMRTWNRRADLLTEVIELQASMAGDALTMNLGVLDPAVYEQAWGVTPAAFTGEPECTVRSRIGDVAGAIDLWWSVEDDETPNRVAASMRTHGLLFLECMRSRDAMAAFLEASGVLGQRYPLPKINYAILKSLLGDVTAARSVLSDLESSSLGAWRDRVGDVSARLGRFP